MAVIGGTAITWLAAGLLGAQPATVEALPGRCRRCRCPTCARCRTWVLPALVMTLLAGDRGDGDRHMAFARRANEPFDGNQELVGQGLANLTGLLLIVSSQRFIQPLRRERGGQRPHRRWRRSAPPCC